MTRSTRTALITAGAVVTLVVGIGVAVETADTYDPSVDTATPSSSTSAAAATAPPPTTSSTTTTPDTNRRGNITGKVGTPITLSTASGQEYARVTVTNLAVESCTNLLGETYEPLVLRYTVTTPADAPRRHLTSVMNPFDMSLLNDDTGVTSQHNPMPECMEFSNNLTISTQMAPGSTYQGGMLFHDAPPAGAVIYNPQFTGNGVEWHY